MTHGILSNHTLLSVFPCHAFLVVIPVAASFSLKSPLHQGRGAIIKGCKDLKEGEEEVVKKNVKCVCVVKGRNGGVAQVRCFITA